MTEAERVQQQLDLIVNAITAVREAAEEEQKITHSKHIDPLYQQALGRLEGKLAGVSARAYRIQTLGR